MSKLAIGLVIVMLALAATACAFNLSTAKIDSAKMTLDQDGKNETSVYGPQDVFYCIVKLKSAPDDTKTKAVWKAVEVSGMQPDETLGEYTVEGSGIVTFQITPNGSWTPGKYKVELYLNDKKKKTVEFQVQG